MIIEWMINLGVSFFSGIMSMLGVLPDLPEKGIHAIDYIFGVMSGSVGLAGIFIDMNLVRILIPIAIAIFNFDHIFKFIMFVLKKIPIINVK